MLVVFTCATLKTSSLTKYKQFFEMTQLLKIAFSTLFAMFVTAAQAQTTPEAAIGAVPDLPSTRTLASADESARQQVREFVRKINAIDSAYTRSVTPDITDADVEQAKQQAYATAERQTQAALGKSVDEIKNMSEADLKNLATGKTDDKLSSLGFGNVAQLSSMSERDLMAAAGNNLGLSAAEMSAMSNMSDKEIEAYMKKGDRMQRVQNSKAAKNAQAAMEKQPKVNPDDILALQNAVEEQAAYQQRFNDLQKLIESERSELAAQFADKEERTRREIENSPEGKTVADCSGETLIPEAQCKAASAAVVARWQACREECFALWSAQVVKEQGRIKALLPEARRIDGQNADAQRAQARINPDAINSVTKKVQDFQRNTASLVTFYLSTSANVVQYPVNLK
jgi:hypothetical protein